MNARIIRKRIAGHNALFFRYDANPDMTFEVSLYREIGEPFKREFDAILKRLGLKLRIVEIAERPWLITTGQRIARKTKKQVAHKVPHRV